MNNRIRLARTIVAVALLGMLGGCVVAPYGPYYRPYHYYVY